MTTLRPAPANLAGRSVLLLLYLFGAFLQAAVQLIRGDVTFGLLMMAIGAAGVVVFVIVFARFRIEIGPSEVVVDQGLRRRAFPLSGIGDAVLSPGAWPDAARQPGLYLRDGSGAPVFTMSGRVWTLHDVERAAAALRRQGVEVVKDDSASATDFRRRFPALIPEFEAHVRPFPLSLLVLTVLYLALILVVPLLVALLRS